MKEVNNNNSSSHSNSTNLEDKNQAEKIKPHAFGKKFFRLKSVNFSKTFVAFIALFLGIGGTIMAQNIIKSREKNLLRHQFYHPFGWHQDHDHFFDDYNAFKEMKIMEMQADEIFFRNHRKRMENIFAQAQKNGELNQTSVSSREDENFYYYELNFSGFNKEEISVKIENNSLTFAAQNKKEISQVKKEDKNHKDSSSSFYYSFSLTQFDNKKEPKIIRQDNKIIVKLSKKILKS